MNIGCSEMGNYKEIAKSAVISLVGVESSVVLVISWQRFVETSVNELKGCWSFVVFCFIDGPFLWDVFTGPDKRTLKRTEIDLGTLRIMTSYTLTENDMVS